jgi:hypothetical protein
LPDVVAGTHFGVPSYKVHSKNFIGVDRDGGCAVALADEGVAELRSAGVTFDEIRRAGNLIGVRIELSQVTPEPLPGSFAPRGRTSRDAAGEPQARATVS